MSGSAPPEHAQLVSTGQVAEALGVHYTTVVSWCRNGDIPGAFQVREGGHWRIPRTWLDAILARVAGTQAAEDRLERAAEG